MIKNFACKILVVLVVVLVSVRPAAAQFGTCPPGSFMITTPAGTWPDGTHVCTPSSNNDIVELSWAPCTQQILAMPVPLLPGDNPYSTVLYLPPADQDFFDIARVRFWFNFNESFLFGPNDYAWEIATFNLRLRIRTFSPTHELLDETTHSLNDYTTRVAFFTGDLGGLPVTYYYTVWDVNQIVTTTGFAHGGYFSVVLLVDTTFNYPNWGHEYLLSSWRAAMTDTTQPEPCPPPNVYVPTHTPIPTMTGTPFNTPTLAPTSPGSTITPIATGTPAPTNTPFQWNTVTPLPTATRWPAIILPTLRFETPVYVPQNGPESIEETSTPDLSGFNDVGTSVSLIATQFYTSTNLGVGFDDPIAGLPTPNTTPVPPAAGFGPASAPGLASPSAGGTFSEFLLNTPSYVAAVINLLATIPEIFPNLYPMVYVIMLMVMLSVMTYMVIYGVRALVALVLWIMRLLGLIPFVG